MVKLPHVTAGVRKGSILGPLLFLIYINDLSEELSANTKLFADDTSLFSVIHDSQTSANDLNKDLETTHNWAFEWKMNFNQDFTKQAPEFIFSRKTKKTTSSFFIAQSIYQKHLAIILDSKLTFEKHINTLGSRINGGSYGAWNIR